MKCNRCYKEFLHGDRIYDNSFKTYCEDCIEEVLIELVQDDFQYAAEKFGFELCKFDARDDSLYSWRN